MRDIRDGQLRVFPNPATEFITVDLQDISPSAKISLYDSQGRQVLERRLKEGEPVPVSDLARGIYMYRVSDRGKLYEGKILVK